MEALRQLMISLSRYQDTYSAESICLNVSSAWSKKSNTIDALKSCSGGSSISRIWEKVARSRESPPTEARGASSSS